MNPININALSSFQENQTSCIKRKKTPSPFFQAYEKLCQENDTPSQVSCSDLDQIETRAYELVIGRFAIINAKSAPDQSFILSRPKKNYYQIGLVRKKLGAGSYGEVYHATFFTGDKKDIAVKFSIDEEKDALESIEHEIKTLKTLHKLSKTPIDIQPLPLTTAASGTLFSGRRVTGYTMDLFECNYSDFMQSITTSARKPLTEHFFIQMATQGAASLFNTFTHFVKLASAVDFLHEKGIFHSDIKCENVLMNHGNIKLWDFGGAKNTALGQNPNPETCTYENSPFRDLRELALKNYEDPIERQEAIELAFKIDEYQLGDLFYRVFYWLSSGYLSHSKPYELESLGIKEVLHLYPKHFIPSFNAEERAEAIPQDFPHPARVSTESETLIKQMVAVNKAERPPIKKVIEFLKSALTSFHE